LQVAHAGLGAGAVVAALGGQALLFFLLAGRLLSCCCSRAASCSALLGPLARARPAAALAALPGGPRR
jgi:hypothetical protein